MSSKRNASMIVGISMGVETCLIHGQVSLSYSIGRKTSRRTYVVRGEINEKTAVIKARLFLARTLGENGKECQPEGEPKVGSRKRFILTMHENCEESISSTPRIRNLRKPSRTHVRSWKRQLLLLCPAKL